MAQRATKELVLMARKHIESRGEYASEEKIRVFIGFGSDRTINKLNNEILAEFRMEALSRSIYLPSELSTLWMSSAANKADEMTAVISKELEEKNLSLLAAIDQGEKLREQIETLENKVTDIQEHNSELKAAALQERTTRESLEKSSETTIEGQATALQTFTDERDELLEKNGVLMIEAARYKEAAEHQSREIKRLEKAVEETQDSLQEERGKAAVAVEKAEWLTKALEQKTDEGMRLSDMEQNLTEQFRGLQESLLSDKVPAKTPGQVREKSSAKSKKAKTS